MTLPEIIANVKARATAAELAARSKGRGSREEHLAAALRSALHALEDAQALEAPAP